MATFKNRALTIATVGLLSGAPVTIATDGLIQLPDEPVTPPVEVIDSTKPAGGFTSIPDREFHVSLRGEYRGTEWFTVFDRSTSDFDAVPRNSEYDAVHSIALLTLDETVFSQYTSAEGEDLVVLVDTSDSAFIPPYRMEDVDEFVVYEDGDLAFITVDSATRVRFSDRFPVTVRMSATEAFFAEPYVPMDVTVADDLALEIQDVSDNDFSRSRRFADTSFIEFPLTADADIVFNGSTHSYLYLAMHDAATLKDWSVSSFTRPFVEPKDDAARLLLLFAQAFLEGEDD